LSDELITVRPYSIINDINKEIVYSPILSIKPRDTLDIPFFTIVNQEKINFEKTVISQASFYLATVNEEPDDEIHKPILVHSDNSWDGNVSNLRYYITSDIDYSNKISNEILNKSNIENDSFISTFSKIELLFNSFIKNMKYVSDRRASVDYVQFPSETIELQGGDCDDLSVCFSSLLESVGIQTALIDYKPNGSQGHVTLLINTNIVPEQSHLITINNRKYFVRESTTGRNEVWIPIEVTALTNFEDAWKIGAEKFYIEAIENFGLSTNKVNIVEIY
jgi:hypothetical protein